jgi:transcriptional regulator with XRE-family HTH domain
LKIGEQLKRRRDDAMLTQEELGKRAGLSGFTISRIESNQVEPRVSTMRKIARALGIEPEELTARPKEPWRSLEEFLQEDVGHAYLATLSREELRDRAQEEGRVFRDACRQERDAVLQERKRFPASAGEITLFTSGEAYRDILRRYFTVSFADWSEEEAALEEERLLAETA